MYDVISFILSSLRKTVAILFNFVLFGWQMVLAQCDHIILKLYLPVSCLVELLINLLKDKTITYLYYKRKLLQITNL